MTKKILILAMLILALSGCHHKKLCYHHPHYNDVEVFIHWDNEADAPGADGMRTNLFLLDGNYEVGRTDMESFGGTLHILPNNTYTAYCYDYNASKDVYIRNETDVELAEACTHEAVRESYSKLFPEEELIEQPDRFFMDKVSPFTVEADPDPSPQELHFHMKNYVETYTIEIRNVKGVEYLTSLGGACSGVAGSFFLNSQTISNDAKTVLFNAQPSKSTQSIVGSFNIFGHCPDASIKNFLTMEVRFPSADPNGGYMHMMWDVTDQMHNGTHHIIIDWGVEFMPTKPDMGSGFDADVMPWDNIWVPITI